jgi:hypothetical protein
MHIFRRCMQDSRNQLTATVKVHPGHTASLTLLDLTNCTDEADLRRQQRQ